MLPLAFIPMLFLAADPPDLRPLWTVPLKSHCFGSAAVADADGDGALDIAFATYFGDHTVRVLRGRDGSAVWAWEDPADNCYDASVRFDDLDGDGEIELLVPCSSGCRLTAFAAKDGRELWKSELAYGECTDSPPWIGDLGGRRSIVVGTFKSNLKVLRASDGAITATIPIASAGAVQTCPIVVDIGGEQAIIAGIFARDKAHTGLVAARARDGEILWRAPLPESIYHGPSLIESPDGRMLRIGTYDGKVYTINPGSGEITHTAETGERYYMSPMVTVDLPDGPLTIAGSESLCAIDAAGAVKWRIPIAENLRPAFETITRGVSVADLSGDGSPDLAYLTSAGLLRVIDARDGRTLATFDAAPLLHGKSPSGTSHSPVLADFDGDGRLDAFFVIGGGGERRPDGSNAERFGLAICLTGFEGRASAENSWPTMRGDNRNEGAR